MTITLDAIHGRVVDVDSHEMMPASRFEEYFGARGRRFLEVAEPIFRPIGESHGPNTIWRDVEDTKEITAETVWNDKGPSAPAAGDFRRRLEVLGAMGIRRQLVFPG